MYCYHDKNEKENCTLVDTNSYTDLKCTWGIYTYIFNHSITNQIDQFHMLLMFTFMIALYLYQCIKLYQCVRYANRSTTQFQLLFWIWTLVKLIQLSYTYIGFQIDQSKLWYLRTLNSLNQTNLLRQNYCDYELKYEMYESQKCFVRYDINGFLLIININFTFIVIQMIAFFWLKQIKPSMFISLFKVLNNINVPLRIKLSYLFFFIIDIIALLYALIVWIFIDCTLNWPTNEPIQYIFPSLTLSYFVYTIWTLHHNGERFYWNQKLIALCTTCFLSVRIIYLFMFQYVLGGTQIIDDYQRTPFFSFITLLLNIFDFLLRILFIELF